MDILIILFFFWSNILGNPDHAGWFSGDEDW